MILPLGNGSSYGGSLVSNAPFPAPTHPSATQEWMITCP